MKKYLWILAAAFLLQACSKDEEEGPYVPWRPGDDKEETIDLDKATKVMILTEQAKNRRGSICPTRPNRSTTVRACSSRLRAAAWR